MGKKRVRGSMWEEVEAGLGVGKRFRVLAHLALNPEKAFTKYALAKITGLRTPSIDRRLKTLVEIGWVKENQYKPKTYQINLENEIVKIIVEFLRKILEMDGRKHPPPPT
ncbi:MAG: helix-turn-helix domain-containing protein [Candidatus Bathyarchaeia archaeon]